MKVRVILSVAAAMTLSVAGAAYAFHSGGVAECEGCHTMHNSFENASVDPARAQFVGAVYLLRGVDQSSTCLKCHAQPDTAPSSYHILGIGYSNTGPNLTPVERTPGGDFAWLLKDHTWTDRGGTSQTTYGQRKGHSIIAADFGMIGDPVISQSPGGSYPGANLSCISCHDPHGKYRINDDATGVVTTSGRAIWTSGSYPITGDATANGAIGVYRLLGGVGYSPKSLAGAHTFTENPPVAVAPRTYNQTEATNGVRVAYGKGMSEWCGNCHGQMHNDTYVSGSSGPGVVHPAGDGAKLTAAIVDNYNAYVKSGDMTGSFATAYNTLIPFEEGNIRSAIQGHASNTGTFTEGAATTNNVMCLSCHRAHASGFVSMVRFDADMNEFMVKGGVYNTSPAYASEGLTADEYQAAMYDRAPTAFASYQRSLCNKCHAKD